MSEKRFRVRFEQEDGRGEIVNEKGVELTAREVVDLLNQLHQENQQSKEENQKLRELVLFYLDVATGECSSHYNKDMFENGFLYRPAFNTFMKYYRCVEKDTSIVKVDFKIVECEGL